MVTSKAADSKDTNFATVHLNTFVWSPIESGAKLQGNPVKVKQALAQLERTNVPTNSRLSSWLFILRN